jgi:3-dehydrosphinganine reductase
MAAGIYYASGCLALVVLVLALDIMGLFSRRNHFDVDGRVCSQAIGLYALKMEAD